MANESTERKFRKMLKDVSGIWVKKLKVLLGREPFDYLVLKNNGNYAFEVKEWNRKNTFYIDQRISPHQIAGLLNFQNVGSNFHSYIFIQVLEKGFYCIPIVYFVEFLSLKKFGYETFVTLFGKFKIENMNDVIK